MYTIIPNRPQKDAKTAKNRPFLGIDSKTLRQYKNII